jgi:hypothetical protein
MEIRVNLPLQSLLPLGAKALFPLNRELNGPQGLYRSSGEEKNLLPLLKFENNCILSRK